MRIILIAILYSFCSCNNEQLQPVPTENTAHATLRTDSLDHIRDSITLVAIWTEQDGTEVIDPRFWPLLHPVTNVRNIFMSNDSLLSGTDSLLLQTSTWFYRATDCFTVVNSGKNTQTDTTKSSMLKSNADTAVIRGTIRNDEQNGWLSCSIVLTKLSGNILTISAHNQPKHIYDLVGAPIVSSSADTIVYGLVSSIQTWNNITTLHLSMF